MQFIDWYYSRTRVIFYKMLQLLESSKLEPLQKISLIKYLIRVAGATNLYVSPEIECSLCNLADSINVDQSLDAVIQKDKVLHVVTKLKSYGGHSRIVERWIELDTRYKNDVVILDPSSEIPKKLNDLIKSQGAEIIVCSEGDEIVRAGQLRTLASGYNHVVLHVIHVELVHMLAFGTIKFTRPVLFMNHTDHLFWLGSMVSDCILNMSSKAYEFTATRRGRLDGEVLPIPLSVEATDEKLNKSVIRESLGLPQKLKVIFSCGHFYKYFPASINNSFQRILIDILRRNKNVLIVVVGVRPNSVVWRLLKFYFSDRLLLIPSCSHLELNRLLSVADVYLDSYPISGFTALCEAVSKDIPIVPIDTGFAYFDSLCSDLVKQNLVVDKVESMLFHSQKIDGKQRLLSHFDEAWIKKMHAVINNMASKHRLYKIRSCSHDVHDLDKTFYYQSAGQVVSLKFIKSSIPWGVKVKLVLLLLSHPVFLSISMILRCKSLFYKVIF